MIIINIELIIKYLIYFVFTIFTIKQLNLGIYWQDVISSDSIILHKQKKLVKKFDIAIFIYFFHRK